MNTILQQELKKILNGRFSQSESTRLNYSRGEDTYDPILSKAVVFPETNEEVSKILKLELNWQKYLMPLQEEGQIMVLINKELIQQFHPLRYYRINGNLVKEAL